MSGYTRQSAADIVPTAVVRAAPLNNELNALRDAFTTAGGHKHDGTTAEGHPVPVIADSDFNNKVAVDTSNNRIGVFIEVSGSSIEQVRIQDGVILPVTNNDVDLGSSGLKFKDAHLAGTATIATANVTTATVNSLSVSSAATIASADINAGTIDGAVIGAASAQAITGTTITATTGFVGPITGAVTGNVTGNLTGNVTGNVTGNLTGNVTATTGSSSFNNVTITGTLNMDSGTVGTITNLSTPTNSGDAATKGYVDTADALKLNLSGGTMSGAIAMGTNKITGLGTPTNTADAATKGYVDTSISNLIDSAPGALDTLNELAAALGDDPNFATTVTTSIASKLSLSGGTMTGGIAMGTNKITGLGTPTASADAATKDYVDTTAATRLALSGGTMSGAIAMGGNKITGLGTPTNTADATTKTYVDTADALKLNLSGGTMSGAIAMGTNKITGLGTPTANEDATTKAYVDSILGSATSAAASAAAAATSASNAATSATNASNSASAAASSATTASNAATAAQTAQTAAELAETNAELAETNAETAETNAAASASAASTSASNAASSASAASTSASNAATSASNAATSASNAATSASTAAGYLAPVTSTSTTSLSISTGSKSLTTETGKDYVAGHPIKIVDVAQPSTNYMIGTVTSYNSGTGAMVVNITQIGGSGTIANWQLSLTYPTGGGGFEVGQTVLAPTAPTTGTWLQTGKYYSKAAYSDLATALGNVPDIGTVSSYCNIPTPFKTTSSIAFGYATATNGTITVAIGQNNNFNAVIKITLNSSGEVWTTASGRSPSTNPNLIRYINNKFTTAGAEVLTSSDGNSWGSYTIPSGVYAYDIAYGSSKYVIAAGNQVLYSSDLVTWTSATVPSSIIAWRIIYANNLFVLANAASNVSSPILTSTDGITWTAQTSSGNVSAWNARDIIYANGLFVAVGINFLYTSTDGTTWTNRTPAGSPNFNSVVYLNGLYIACGNSGILYTSSDGTTWTQQTTNTTNALYHAAWNGTTYVVGSSSGFYLTSTNGTTWTLNRDVSLSGFFSLASINNRIIGFGDVASPILSGATRKEVLANGSWSYVPQTAAGPSNYKMFAYNGSNQYIAVQNGGVILYSSDANDWSAAVTSVGTTLYSADYLNGRYLVGGAAGSNNYLTSTDGTTWTASTTPTIGNIYAFAYGASNYVAAGAVSTNALLYSSDGTTWSTVTTGPSVNINDVIFANSQFVAVGASGAVFTSPTGVTWTSQSAGSTEFRKIIYANSLYVAVGSSGTIRTSSDGITWTAATSGTSNQLNNIAWNGTTFCAVGSSGTILTSTTGTGTWTVVSSSGSVNFFQIFWDGTNFVICADANGSTQVWYSATGAAGTWRTSQTAFGTAASAKFAYLGGKYLSQGSGFIQSSSDARTWTLGSPVQRIPTSVSNVYKLNNRYYALTDVGLFTSSDGDTFTVVANSPRRAITAMAYGNSKWMFATAVLSNPQCEGYYTSTDGTTFTKASDAQNTSFGGTTTSGLVDVVFANGNFVRSTVTSTTANLGLTHPIFTSTDGVTWTGRYGDFFGNAGVMASDGTNIVLSTTTLGILFTSSDGGITWSSLLGTSTSPRIAYSNGAWIFSNNTTNAPRNSISTDLTTFNSVAGAIFSPTYSDGTYVFAFANDTSVASFGVSVANVNGAGIVNTIEKLTMPPFSFITTVTKPLVATSTHIIAPITYNALNNGNLLAKIPLYSYNTSTTFYIPASNASGGQLSYMYAGA